MKILNRTVLVLNRLWRVIGQKSVQQAIVDLAGGQYTALDIDGDKIIPVRWEDWLRLPPLNNEEVIHTQRLLVRMPTVIVSCGYSKVPKRRPKFTLANIAKRDGGRCQYTGRVLTRDRWSLDHVVPRSRGGKDSPDNVVLADKDVNNRKGNKLPQEAGLPLPVIREFKGELASPTHPHHRIFLKD